MIRLTPRIDKPITDVEAFLGFVSICFRQKRKTLRNNLREAYDTVPDISRRAEELSVEEFVDLYKTLGRVTK